MSATEISDCCYSQKNISELVHFMQYLHSLIKAKEIFLTQLLATMKNCLTIKFKPEKGKNKFVNNK